MAQNGQRLRPATPSFPWRVWHLRTSRAPKKKAERGDVIVIVRKKNAEFTHGLSMVYLIEWLEINGLSMFINVYHHSLKWHENHIHPIKSDIPMKNLIKNHNTKISPSMIGAYITNFPYLSSQNMPWHFLFLTKSHQIPN